MAQEPPSTATSTDLFENYVYYAAEAAKLARTACQERTQLAARVEALEGQLALAKLGHVEQQIKARNAQKQLDIVGGDQIVYCVLDGDGCIFNRTLVAKGRDGGREAAILLTKSIDDYASSRGIKGQLTMVVHLYLNKAGLARVLQTCGIADEATFSAFLVGLNAAHPLILVSDVGPSKEACDAKLTQTLKLYAKLPSTKLVLAGAAHDGGYAHLFSSLETEAPVLFDKVTLLKSYDDLAFELKRLNLRTTTFDGLFENKKLVAHGNGNHHHSAAASGSGTPAGLQPPQLLATPRKSSPAVVQHTTPAQVAVASSSSSTATPTSAKAPKTPRSLSAKMAKLSLAAAALAPPVPIVFGDTVEAQDEELKSSKKKKLREIDPTKPLYKQAFGPPCNRHYLLSPSSPLYCASSTSAAPCKYSHAYALTPQQLATLRTDAAKSPCFAALKGRICSDEACFAGHVCPRGARCLYGSKCKFNAPGMHPPGTKGRSDGWAWRGDLYAGDGAALAGSGLPRKGPAYEVREYGTTSGSEGYETTSSLD
ncbi:hypothetical protein JCM3775_000608 [Rhodotorula graminis]